MTAAGRGIAAFLMLSGIALFGVLTANLAAFFLEKVPERAPGRTNHSHDVEAKLDEILERLVALEGRSVSDERA